jgi:putative transposase
MASKHIHYYDQASQLPDIKDIRQEYQDIHSQVLQDVLRRVDKTFKAFFVRCKRGVTPGYPRFKGRDRYDSFTYPQGGYSLTALNILRLGRSQRGATRVEAPCL